jgi:hypothetical protein
LALHVVHETITRLAGTIKYWLAIDVCAHTPRTLTRTLTRT